MTNLERLLSIYKNIFSLSLPPSDSKALRRNVIDLKLSILSVLKCILDEDSDYLISLDNSLSADKPAPSVSLGAKREGRRK